MNLRQSIALLFIGIFFMLGCQESDSGAVMGADGTSSISSSGLSDSSTSNAYNKLLLSDNLFSEGNRNVVVLDNMVILRWELPGNLFEVTTLDHESRKEIKKETVKGNTHFINSLPYGKKYEFHVKDLYSNEIILLFAETGNEFVQTSVSDVSYADDGMILTWNAVPYAAKYNLYYSDESDGTYNFLKEVYGTSIKFDDKSFYQDESEDKILFFSVEAVPVQNRIDEYIYEDEICEDDICEDDVYEGPVLKRSNYMQPQNPSTKSGNTIFIVDKNRDSWRYVRSFSVNANLTGMFFSWTPVEYAKSYEIRNSDKEDGSYEKFQTNITGTSYLTARRPETRPYFAVYPLFQDGITGENFYGSQSDIGILQVTPQIKWSCSSGDEGSGYMTVNITNFSEYKPGSVKLYCDINGDSSYAFRSNLTAQVTNISYSMDSTICYVEGFKYYNTRSGEEQCTSASFIPKSIFKLSISSTGKEGDEFDNIMLFKWSKRNGYDTDISGYSYALKVVDNSDASKVLIDVKQKEKEYIASILSCNVTYKTTLDAFPNDTTTTPSDTIENTFKYDCGGKVTILTESSFRLDWD